MTSAYISEWQKRQRYAGALLAATESPLESILLSALLAESDGEQGYFFTERGAHQLVAQHPIGRYRADFAVLSFVRMVAIEVDSVEFHGSVEQKAAALLRARDIESFGWEVLSFEGPDVSRSPRECARAARRHIMQPALLATGAERVEAIKLSASAMVSLSGVERASMRLFGAVLADPIAIHDSRVADILVRDGGPVALAATALRSTTSSAGVVDAQSFLDACPALLQPTALAILRCGGAAT